jgi:hypothetical protein
VVLCVDVETKGPIKQLRRLFRGHAATIANLRFFDLRLREGACGQIVETVVPDDLKERDPGKLAKRPFVNLTYSKSQPEITFRRIVAREILFDSLGRYIRVFGEEFIDLLPYSVQQFRIGDVAQHDRSTPKEQIAEFLGSGSC